MVLRKPGPGDKIAHFTRRAIGKGKIMLWRFEGEDITNVEYTCPHCGHNGETQQTFEEIKITIITEKGKKKRVRAFRFQCEKCKKDIDIVRWTKKGRKKKT